MKTKKELQKMSNAIGKAIRAYHNAILENLKESGKEHSVEKDWDEDEYDGLHLTIIGRHDDAITIEIDKVHFNKDKGACGAIEAHVCTEDGYGCDYWMMASELGDDVDYLYDNIIW